MMRMPAALIALLLASAPAAADSVLPVQFITVTPGVAYVEHSLTGIAEASNSFAASFPTGGRVISVAVDSGDIVQAGDELARIDPTQQAQALRAAEAGLRAADAGLVRAEQDFDRQKTLLARGAVTRTEFDNANEALLTARAARDQAASQTEKARKALSDTILTAPRDAIVTVRRAEAGEVVASAQSIVDLADPAARDAVFLGPDDMPVDNVMGARLSLRLLEREAPPLAALVTEVSPLVDPATGTVRVKARIDAPPAGMSLLGEPVEGSLVTHEPYAAALPWAALTASGGGMAVWVVNPADMTVSLAPIEVSRFAADLVFVAAGLEPGTVVAGAGSQLLYPGRMVRDAGAK